jgi:hypothetical protein
MREREGEREREQQLVFTFSHFPSVDISGFKLCDKTFPDMPTDVAAE